MPVPVRIAGDTANINLKSAGLDIQRTEFEYGIPVADAKEMLRLCTGTLIEKTRHFVRHEGHLWEIDVFTGSNSGLVMAEIELDSIDEDFARPQWAGAEVSADPRYYNVYLAEHPFTQWPVSPRPASS